VNQAPARLASLFWTFLDLRSINLLLLLRIMAKKQIEYVQRSFRLSPDILSSLEEVKTKASARNLQHAFELAITLAALTYPKKK
jgi:hypothetical protein